MRLFIALPFSESFKNWLEQAGEDLFTLFPPHSLRPARKQNLHLTLQFLGEVPGSHLKPMQSAILQALSGVRAFPFTPGLAGLLPNPYRPRILWIGLEPAVFFTRTANLLGNALSPYIKMDEKKFLPHITLARFNENHAALATVDLKNVVLPCCHLPGTDLMADCVKLYQSELKPSGPVYTEMASFGLQKIC
ncbi:MAG: RNA 2',3'-cyclic phosphodiesterase [Anaerolineaceae bacterium]|nr:RNA 2',3'-cyclic phosphodiesterase [Anaerolineaceae bacterium]